MNTALSELIHQAYNAAGSERRWLDFLAKYVEATGALGASLVHRDLVREHTSFSQSVGLDRKWMAWFHEHYQFVNPYKDVFAISAPGTCTTAHQLYSKSECMKTEYYEDFIKPQKLHLNVVGAILTVNESSATALMVQHSADRTDASVSAMLPVHQQMVPHLCGAMRIHERIGALDKECLVLCATVEHTRTAVVVCGADGRVDSATLDAEVILRQADGLSVVAGKLTAPNCRNNIDVLSLIADVAQLANGRKGAPSAVVRVRRPSGGRDYELLISPLPQRLAGGRETLNAALVFITDPGLGVPTDVTLLHDLYSLTQREGEVLHLVVAGLSTREMASALQIGEETIRTHLRALFAKTGTRRQAQLVATVSQSVAKLRTRQR